ncbi:MAG: preprotein translocase subunit SecF [Cycloclasticus pugetii]|jgi:preprotein translocase subunit SecF|uniref:Protein-export membrane protein SecF n=1 Tax=Cycloclasticus zancles 78-ME TaxID=1198232 RepID=S5TWX6_9GAMM|nr:MULTISPECIES: protein translocase subunit SecF [Cycloclasticus]AFT67301.1 Preprotein translocase subunit SecF [Cycloclasticus sp. P1]AGS39493.1 Preprotein translocase subunit SecF [Cycloclasticus zancles 78-ME]MBV1899413.1 protein translocase subunit SecF [Cycloclasticus sp.]
MSNQHTIKIDFLSKRKIALIFSTLLIIVSIASLATMGLKKGIDFTGGTLVELSFPEAVELESLRNLLTEANFSGAVVQHFGSSKEVLIRLLPNDALNTAALSNKVLAAVNENFSQQGELRRAEFVGPQVGEELQEDGGLALLYALICILIYVAIRFEYRFGLGSVAALAHDVIITLGFFSVFQFEFDLTVLAAILAIIGYSLNDTIVVFDRVRENFRTLRKGSPVDVVNISLNQTFTRTVMTSLTTLLVLIALFVLGGEIIHDFALALIVGVLIGTYSSIYVASPITLALGVTKEDLMVVKVDQDELDKIP